jgi:hypothetical protein
MSESHFESGSKAQETHGAPKASKSSSRRLLVVSLVMVGFAATAWGPALFQRNVHDIFIPVWLTLTIATVIISFWFTKRIMTYESYRDSETVPPVAPAHH